MELLSVVATFFLGVSVGSFTGVVVEREGHSNNIKLKGNNRLILFLVQSFPWVLGRSRCDKCKRELRWFDNIPLISFILLRGKCRFCDAAIPFRYFVVELLMGFTFVWGYLNLTSLASPTLGQISPIFNSANLFGSLSAYPLLLLFTIFVFLWALASITLVDFRFGLIPDGILLASGLIVLLIRIFLVVQGDPWLNSMVMPFFWAFVSSFFFAFLILITKGKGMGWGDVKLVFWMGLWLGWQILIALWLAFLTGAVAGIILILYRRKKWGQTLPFGPFLAWGTLVSAFAGDYLVSHILPKLFP